ncbi:MAG: 50S ribosomal protein L10 [Bdellovibrionales bacterium RIFOXYD1_FULL_53_11]|nr:MAG: 50S ribosomal protein L10 [Bdellovibrionales bacterium RIFOXYD1_FULL_53_11]
MNRTEKTELAGKLKEKFTKARVAVFADYKGLTATQADDLRRQLRAQNTEVRVLKNNVARLLAKEEAMGSGAREVLDGLVGPTLVAFGYNDAAGTAKVIHKFSKDNEALTLKDSIMMGRRIDASGVEELAKLPPREVLLAKLLGTLNAPVTNFVGVLAAVPRSLLNALSAIEKKKGGV